MPHPTPRTPANAEPLIRPYRAQDRPALYRICLLTGAAGADASGRYDDPDLLGHVYLGPYLALAAHLAFVVTGGPDGPPLGYTVATADTAAFAAACERRWWPALRARYPDPAAVAAVRQTPDQRLASLIHRPPVPPPEITARYPAHLHLDLLPQGQGQGLGSRLLLRMLETLATAGAIGVHLGVDPANHRAARFYRRHGFTEAAPFMFVRDLAPARLARQRARTPLPPAPAPGRGHPPAG